MTPAPPPPTRQAVTVDRLSGSRRGPGPGLGSDLGDGPSCFGGATDPRERAGHLEEGPGILDALPSGQSADHRGAHYNDQRGDIPAQSDPGGRDPVRLATQWPNRSPIPRWLTLLEAYRTDQTEVRRGVEAGPGGGVAVR